MRKILMLVTMVVLMGTPLAAANVAGGPGPQGHQLKKRHKEQRKTIKQQQRAMKNVVSQHPQSSEERQRFKHDLKMQRQLLRKNQKNESRNLRQSLKLRKRPRQTS